ncbi:hypothetical protein [Streptomyces acidicola]|uniref:hypothetical protein n=1 Tax=Streptomyces acidicola TaxID=2596892 RepID=UPI0037F11EF1
MSPDIAWSRPLREGAGPSAVTVSQDAAGRWFVSLLCEDPSVGALPATDAAVGVDGALDRLLTLSTGEKITNVWRRRPRAMGRTGPRPAARSPASLPASPTGDPLSTRFTGQINCVHQTVMAVIAREMVAGRKPDEVSREVLGLLDDMEGLLSEKVLNYAVREAG